MQDRPLIIGHRGAPCVYPEHTRASYRAAVAAGVDLVEPDVVPSKDGILVVIHGPRLDETTDVAERPEFASRRVRKRFGRIAETGWFVEDFTWDELRTLRCVERWPDERPASAAWNGTEPPMRLRDLVTMLDVEAPGVGLVIEFKHDDRTRRVGFDFVELLERELEGLWDAEPLTQVRWESFERDVLIRLRDRGIGGRRIQLVEDAAQVMDGEEGPARLRAAGLDEVTEWAHGVSVRTRLLTEAMVETAHARSLEVLTFTARPEDRFLPPSFAGNPEGYWRALVATGVDGVFVDDPARFAAMLDSDQDAAPSEDADGEGVGGPA